MTLFNASAVIRRMHVDSFSEGMDALIGRFENVNIWHVTSINPRPVNPPHQTLVPRSQHLIVI